MEVKKKKSETTLQQTETNESYPKFMEMQSKYNAQQQKLNNWQHVAH